MTTILFMGYNNQSKKQPKHKIAERYGLGQVDFGAWQFLLISNPRAPTSASKLLRIIVLGIGALPRKWSWLLKISFVVKALHYKKKLTESILPPISADCCSRSSCCRKKEFECAGFSVVATPQFRERECPTKSFRTRDQWCRRPCACFELEIGWRWTGHRIAFSGWTW